MLNLGFFNTSGSRTQVSLLYSTHAAAGGNVAPSSSIDAADIRIYRAADSGAVSATQRSSASGITSTSPFDSLTGFHAIDIDLTDNTDAGFYASGYRYFVVLAPSDETIDSLTITGVVLGYFEIGVQPVNVTQLLGTAWLTPAVAGTPDVNAKQMSGSGTAADNLETAALAYSATRGLAGTALPAAAADAAGGLPISDAGGLDLDAKLANTDQVTSARMGALTDWIDGGRLDLILDARSSQTSVDDVPTNAELTTALAAADDAVLAAIAALNNLSSSQAATAVLTTQMTEAYAADGTAPTLAQAIFLLMQSLHEFAISGTTRTVKKLDGTTTAATFTLDSSTAPTSTTRAS